MGCPKPIGEKGGAMFIGEMPTGVPLAEGRGGIVGTIPIGAV